MRRPPLHGVLPTAHDMGREHRIIAALGPTPVPVPEALAYCDDADVIGAPFYVMSYVEGIVLHDDDTAERRARRRPRAPTAASRSSTRSSRCTRSTSTRSDSVTSRAATSWCARQLKRWHAQFEASKTRERPGRRPRARRCSPRASRRRPRARSCTATSASATASSTPRGEIRAVLDWEICTLGDPRADVGYVLATWAEPGDPLRADDHNPTLGPGLHDARRAARALRRAVGTRRRPPSRTSSPSRSGDSPASSRACWPVILSGARGEGDVDVDYFRRRVESCAQLAEEYASGL